MASGAGDDTALALGLVLSPAAVLPSRGADVVLVLRPTGTVHDSVL